MSICAFNATSGKIICCRFWSVERCTSTISIDSWQCTSSRIRPQFHRLEHHLVLNGRNIQCNTENYVLVVVLGLTTGPSSSSTSTSSTSVPQDSVRGDSLPSPASTRSRSTRSRALGDQLRDSNETQNKYKIEDIDRARESPLRDLPGLRNSLIILWTNKLTPESEAPASISREPLRQEPPIKVVSEKARW